MSAPPSPFAASETQNSSPRPLPLPHRRRDKPQLSCTLCRKRKLKCDRGQPCETCIKRGLSLSCTYVYSSGTLETHRKSHSRPPAYLKLQERIGQLENLIASQVKGSGPERLTDQRPAEPGDTSDFPPSISDDSLQEASELSTRLGRISVENAGTTWVESDHWTAILDGVGELKDSLENTQGENEYDMLSSNVPDFDGPELLLGDNKHVGKQEILAAIPNRPVADRLVSQFFQSVDTAPMILHIPSFLREYENFWDNPDQASISWIGLLFAILCLAVLQQQFGFEPSNQVQHVQGGGDSRRLAQNYRTKISQCLVLANYTKPAPYTMETLLLYVHVEYIQSKDTQTGLWILLGITVRLALRMGCHRDASHFPRISPFHAEMRRRIWCVIFMMDAGASAQFGLPRMVRASQSNTTEPRNLLDEDIQADMYELPSARPESVLTPVQYFVAKNRVISVSGKISDLKTLTQSPQYTEILRLDGALHSAYDSIPHSLAMRPMSKSIIDSPTIIIQRVYIALVFYKAKCILHRTYLIAAKTDGRYTYSRTACIEAALEILHIQQILDQETQVGGRLHAERGKVSSVMKSDFFLATTILCVDVNHTITEGSSSVSRNATLANGPSLIVIEALHVAYQIWLRSSDSSQEAQQAARVLKIVLDKAQTMNTESSTGFAGTAAGTPATSNASHLRSSLAAPAPISERASAVDTRLMTSDPTFLLNLDESGADLFPELSQMDFGMGNQWGSDDGF